MFGDGSCKVAVFRGLGGVKQGSAVAAGPGVSGSDSPQALTLKQIPRFERTPYMFWLVPVSSGNWRK